jgi:hypothetical protein
LQQNEDEWLQHQAQASNITIITPERALVSLGANGNTQERRSFDFYRAKTAPCCGFLDSSFWNEFLLQLSHSEPAIRYALVAIGALNERLRPKKDYDVVSRGSDPNFKLALSSYNKAIKHLTTQMQHENSDLIALLTCILFICVEFLQDNVNQALTLVHQGCAIIRAQGRTLEERSGDPRFQSQQIMIDQQVMPMFTRLTVLSALCGRPAVFTVPDETEQEASMSFHDLKGARASLYTLMEQGHAIVRRADACKWLKGENIELEKLRLEHARAVHLLDLWHTGFVRVQVNEDLSKSSHMIHAVALLSMYFTTTSIWLATCLQQSQECYDAHHAQFRKIIEAAELIINTSEGQAQGEILFTFEMGIVPPLYFTATRCRLPALRRQAVSLMQRAPTKEGMWDRAEMVYMAKLVILMEEGGEYDVEEVMHMPKELARLHDIMIERGDAAPGQRKTVVKFISKLNGLDGPWHVEKEHFDA